MYNSVHKHYFFINYFAINLVIIIKAKTKPNAVPSIFSYKPFIVLSGSMEDKINVGDLVFVKEVDSKTLRIDDIIAFRDSSNHVTTHRIVNTVAKENGTCYVTKGDNNNTTDDEIICPKSIEGKYMFKIAELGNIVNNVQQAVSNEGDMTIGVKDGNIDLTTPIIIGETHAIHNIGNINIYDGILKGITGAIDGEVTDIEENSQIVNDSEVTDGKTYNVEYYELLP